MFPGNFFKEMLSGRLNSHPNVPFAVHFFISNQVNHYQRKCTNNQILTYRLSLVISNVRYLFQNIGSLYDDICKNCYLLLTMGLSSEKKKRKWTTFLFLSAHYHIYVAVNHTSILNDNNTGLHDPAWLLQLHIMVRFGSFLGLLIEMACFCADMDTVCCSIEYRLW